MAHWQRPQRKPKPKPKPWTVEDLRRALAHVPGDVPVIVETADYGATVESIEAAVTDLGYCRNGLATHAQIEIIDRVPHFVITAEIDKPTGL